MGENALRSLLRRAFLTEQIESANPSRLRPGLDKVKVSATADTEKAGVEFARRGALACCKDKEIDTSKIDYVGLLATGCDCTRQSHCISLFAFCRHALIANEDASFLSGRLRSQRWYVGLRAH